MKIIASFFNAIFNPFAAFFGIKASNQVAKGVSKFPFIAVLASIIITVVVIVYFYILK